MSQEDNLNGFRKLNIKYAYFSIALESVRPHTLKSNRIFSINKRENTKIIILIPNIIDGRENNFNIRRVERIITIVIGVRTCFTNGNSIIYEVRTRVLYYTPKQHYRSVDGRIQQNC